LPRSVQIMLILAISFCFTILDQVTKQLVREHFVLGERLPMIPGFFNLTYVRNTGAAWGMLSGLNSWLVLLSIIILGFLIFFRRAFLSDTVMHQVAAGLMLSGIIGNLIDRIRLGYVVDFLDFHPGFDFPSFNVADASICTGVGLYLLSQLIANRTAEPES